MIDSKFLEKHKAEAAAVGLTLLGPGKTARHRTYRFNECQHEQEIETGGVRGGVFRCRQCLNEQLEAEAATVGLTLLGPGKNRNYRTYRFNECKHEQGIKADHVREGVFRCRQCLNEQLEAEAVAAGLTLLGPGKNKANRTYRFNECGHEQEIQTGHVRDGVFHCQKCFDEQLKAEAAQAGVTLIGPGKVPTYRTYRFNECKHKQGIRTDHVRIGNLRCGQCLNEKLESEADALGLTLIGPGDNPNYRIYQFNECGHEQEIQTGQVRSDSFVCNTCEETARDLPSNVYLVKIKASLFEWLKLGYAKNVDQRIKRYGLPADANVTTIVVRPFDTGREAHSFEESIHVKYANRGLLPVRMKEFHTYSGFDECYPIELLDQLANELRGVTDLLDKK